MEQALAQQAAEASPRAEYARRLEARREEAAELAARHRALNRGRKLALGLVVAVIWLAEKERLPVKVTLAAAPAVLLEGLMVWRNRVGKAWRRAAKAADFYEQRLACVEGRWAGGGRPGTRYLDEEHPCAADLDLFGRGCLFELLCTARTRAGEDTLAAWLKAPAGPDVVRERQAAVAELRGRLDLREEVALLGADVPDGGELAALAEWGQAAPALTSRPLRAVGLVVTALVVVGMIASAYGAGPWPFLGGVALAGAFALWLRAPAGHVLGPVERAGHVLGPWATLLARLGRERFTAPLLCRLRAALDEGGPAARRAARLGRSLAAVPRSTLLLRRGQRACAVDAWRQRSGIALGRWLAAVGEFEALCALAAHAYESPDDPFPEVVADGPCFDAEGLGHPLIPRESCVRNDVALAGELRVLVVSGSNMSGKSTLLRTVGVNAVLALAGAPVRARRLRLSPLAVGATLRVQDSLQAGRSRFYAEITRVRRLLDMARAGPLLFLLDEVFQGTNSGDRRQGAEAVVRRLVEAGALGLVTTHDLALTGIAERLAPRAANVHFEDRFEGGAMTFDYRMRPGVVQSTNGLALMRAVGIV
ncbi:MAG TPA: hypothetical protein VFE78_34495 [Gemmataceae bacterium]|nr:hypothetical protein [Gemmataceae bacterium]